MKVSSLPAVAVVVILALVLGCSSAPEAPESTVAPPVEVDLSAADPDAAAMLQELVESAAASAEDAALRGELGMAYAINGYQIAAMTSYEQAAEMDPTEPRWKYLLALARVQSGDLDGALVAMRESIDLDPSYVSSHLHRGFWLLDMGEAVESERTFRTVLDMDPVNRAGLLGLARSMYRQDRNDEVIEMLEAATVDRPGDGYLFHLLGNAYRFQGEQDKAAVALAKGQPDTEALRWKDPWSEDKMKYLSGYGADMLQAEVFLLSGKSAEAIAVFESLRMRRPGDLQMLNNLSVAYRRADRVEESLEVLESGVEIHPEYFPFHMNLATAYEQEGDVDRALEHLDRVIELNPSLGEAYQRKGRILIDQDRLEEALVAYEAALSYESGNPMNFLYAGAIASRIDQCDRAIRWLETVIRMQPEMVPAFIPLAKCRATTGDFVGARMALDRVAEIAPDLKNLTATREFVAEIESKQP